MRTQVAAVIRRSGLPKPDGGHRRTRWWRVGSALALALGAAGFLIAYAVTDPSEPNNDAAHATPLSVGLSKGHSLEPAGDEDWYTFTLAQRTKVVVNAYYTQSNQFENVDLNFYHDLGGGNLDDIRADYINTFDAIADPGVYYIKVTELNGLSLAEYDLELSELPATPDPYEPDNTQDAATRLAFGVAVTGHTIAPEGDVDWYKFTVPSGVTDVVLEATIPSGGSSSALGEILITVFDANSYQVPGSGQTDQVFLSVTPGTYYAKLEGASGSDISAVYTVRLWDQSAPDPFENDDTPARATWLPADGSMQTHNLNPVGDQDWYHFYANAGDNVAIEFNNTGDNANPVATFFASDGVTPIDTGGFSTLSVTQTGFYYLRVTNDPSINTATDTVYTIGAPRQPPGILPGALVGVVSSGAKGAVIPSATVGINFGSFSTQTDATGAFAFPALPPDNYQVTVTASGFQTAVASVGVASGSTEQDFQLTPTTHPPTDINGDNTINAVDVQLVINGALHVNIGGLDADVNHDGTVNAVDVQLVVNAALGL